MAYSKYKRRYKKKLKVTKDVKKYVKKAIRIDKIMKQHYIPWADATPVNQTTGSRYIMNITNAGSGIWSNGLYRGDNYNQRTGDQIKIYQIEFHCTLGIIGLAPSATTVRCLILYDKEPDGTQITTTELIATANLNLGVNAPLRHDMAKKYRILSDRRYDIVSQYEQSAPGGDRQIISYKRKFKQPLLTTFYVGAESGTINEMSIGAVYAILWADTANISAFNASTSILFTDA